MSRMEFEIWVLEALVFTPHPIRRIARAKNTTEHTVSKICRTLHPRRKRHRRNRTQSQWRTWA